MSHKKLFEGKYNYWLCFEGHYNQVSKETFFAVVDDISYRHAIIREEMDGFYEGLTEYWFFDLVQDKKFYIGHIEEDY